MVLTKSLKTNVKPKPCRLFKQLLNYSAIGTVPRLARRGTSQFKKQGAKPKAAKCMVIAQPCIWQSPPWLSCVQQTLDLSCFASRFRWHVLFIHSDRICPICFVVTYKYKRQKSKKLKFELGEKLARILNHSPRNFQKFLYLSISGN